MCTAQLALRPLPVNHIFLDQVLLRVCYKGHLCWRTDLVPPQPLWATHGVVAPLPGCSGHYLQPCHSRCLPMAAGLPAGWAMSSRLWPGIAPGPGLPPPICLGTLSTLSLCSPGWRAEEAQRQPGTCGSCGCSRGGELGWVRSGSPGCEQGPWIAVVRASPLWILV